MSFLFFLASLMLLMLGHWFKLLRWKAFIKLYEAPPQGALLRAMSFGYALNFVLPFKLGEIFRAIYAGRKMKNGTGLALATIILDRFLDMLAVSVIFAVLWIWDIQRGLVLDSAGFYFIATAIVLIGLVFVNTFSSGIKRATMMLCSIFNDRLKLACEKFFWALINTFRDLPK